MAREDLKYIIKEGDTDPIEVVLRDRNGRVNLNGATVTFKMQDLDGNQIVDAVATVTDATAGEVEYSWAAADVATAGEYEAEFHVLQGTGAERTFPSDDYIQVVILPDRG